MKINFIYQNEFLLSKESIRLIKDMIRRVTKDEKKDIQFVSVIFCGDKFIREFNKNYLKHDYETDIVTFHDINEDGAVEGELMVSTETVKKNSIRFNVKFEEELQRVIIHGVLHLCGFNDMTKTEKELMREKENYYLNIN